MKHSNMIKVSSEFKIREALNEQINNIILPKQLECISWDARYEEYREYFLSASTQLSGCQYGDIDKMINVFNIWKNKLNDNMFKIILEYEAYTSNVGKLYPTGEDGIVGILVKVERDT